MKDEMKAKNYEVGYKKPPKGSQFKKGVSGNVSGRPRKPKDFVTNVWRELNSPLTIIENGKRTITTKAEAMAKQAVNKAIGGNIQCLRLAVECSRQALEKAAEQQRMSPNGPTAEDLSDDDLARIILAHKLAQTAD